MTTVDEMDFELDLSVDELAGVFTAKGWQLADTAGVYPLPEEIGANIDNLVGLMLEQPEASFAQLGRVAVFRDEEFPGSVEVALIIGRAMPALGHGADAADEGGTDLD